MTGSRGTVVNGEVKLARHLYQKLRPETASWQFFDNSVIYRRRPKWTDWETVFNFYAKVARMVQLIFQVDLVVLADRRPSGVRRSL